MTDQPAEPEGLTDQEIAPDIEPDPRAESDQASDPDIRNTAPGQEPPDDETDAPGS
jgi:hypothetical protein